MHASLIRPVKEKWLLASNRLRDQQRIEDYDSDSKQTISDAQNMLCSIGWSTKINGFPGPVTTESLTPYFTTQWLSDEQENQMLHLLKQQVILGSEHREDSDDIEVVNTFFLASLKNAYHTQETYSTDPWKSWIRKIGQDLGSGLKSLATLGNINSNH